MKTLILTLSIAGCVLTARAQQPQLLPKAKEPQWKRSFNDSLSLNKPKSSTFSVTAPVKGFKHADKMPIAPTQNRDPKMPIVKTDRTGYKMPIAGKKDSTTFNRQIAPTTTYDGALTPPPKQ